MSLVKNLMQLFPSFPDPTNYDNWEVICSEKFKTGSERERSDIMCNLVQTAYDHETKYCTLEKYFPRDLLNNFANKSVLDLGSFCGGRMIRWVEKFGFSSAAGLDINSVFVDAFETYKNRHEIDTNNSMKLNSGFGEHMPFEDSSFDFIISFDVMEHVKDPRATLTECYRVLRKGGRAYIVFPQYHQPLDSHLRMVTKLPALQWFFSPQAINNAYYEITKSRGESANWYALKSPVLEDWEVIPSLNGTTIKRMAKIVRESDFNLVATKRPPIFGGGRRAESSLFFKTLKQLCWIPAQLPFFREYFQGKIVLVLEK